jgi:hypothetical protein
LASVQVLGEQERAAGAYRSGNDQPVIDREAVSLGDVESEFVGLKIERPDRAHGADRHQDLAKLAEIERKLAPGNCREFVEHLNAHHAADRKQRFGPVGFRGVLREEIDGSAAAELSLPS